MSEVHLDSAEPALLASLLLDALDRGGTSDPLRPVAVPRGGGRDPAAAEKLDLIEALRDAMRHGCPDPHRALAVHNLLHHLALDLLRASARRRWRDSAGHG